MRKPFYLDTHPMKTYAEMVEDSLFGRDLDPTSPINQRPRHEEALKSFVAYCKAHPQQRFWQALRNWSKYHVIYGFNGDVYALEDSLPESELAQLYDTFNLEGLDGTRET